MKALARIVIEQLLFLALCDEEILDPDTAANKLEYVTYYLSECSEEEKQAVLEIIAEMKQEAVKRGDRASIEILDMIPENTWPADEDEETSGG